MLLTHRVLEHRARAVVALLALVIAAFGISACGGSDGGGGGGGGSSDAETLLTQAFANVQEIDSGVIDAKVTIAATGEPSITGPITLALAGPFTRGDAEYPQFDVTIDVGAQGQGFEAGLTSTGEKLFVKFGGSAYEVPQQLLNQQGGAGSMSLKGLGIDPMSWLQDPETVGTEEVGGVETDHVAADVDVDALLDDVDGLLAKLSDQLPAGVAGTEQIPDAIPADARKEIEDAIESATLDVWVGTADQTPRKLTVKIAAELPESADGPSSLDVELTISIDELNEPQTIEAPTDTRPITELLGALQGFLGGGLLGGDSFGGGSSSGSDEVPNLDEYTECLQDAGNDSAKMQECAELLTP